MTIINKLRFTVKAALALGMTVQTCTAMENSDSSSSQNTAIGYFSISVEGETTKISNDDFYIKRNKQTNDLSVTFNLPFPPLDHENGLFPEAKKTYSCGSDQSEYWNDSKMNWEFKNVVGDKGNKIVENLADFLSLPSGDAKDDFVKYLSKHQEKSLNEMNYLLSIFSAPQNRVKLDMVGVHEGFGSEHIFFDKEDKITLQNQEGTQGTLELKYTSFIQQKRNSPVTVRVLQKDDPHKVLDSLFSEFKGLQICPNASRKLTYDIRSGYKQVTIFPDGAACEEQIFKHISQDIIYPKHLSESKM